MCHLYHQTVLCPKCRGSVTTWITTALCYKIPIVINPKPCSDYARKLPEIFPSTIGNSQCNACAIRTWQAAQAAKAQAQAQAQARAQQHRFKTDAPIQNIFNDNSVIENRVISNTLNVKNLNIVGPEQQQGQRSFGQSQRSRSMASSSPSIPATQANFKPSGFIADVSGDGGAGKATRDPMSRSTWNSKGFTY